MDNSSALWCNVTVKDAQGAEALQLSFCKTATSGGCQAQPGMDAMCNGGCRHTPSYPSGTTVPSADACCALCLNDTACANWVYAGDTADNAPNCWLLLPGTVIHGRPAQNRTLGAPKNYFVQHQLQVRTATGFTWKAGDGLGRNLRGTLVPTPSADLAGCCTNPNQTAGVFDPHFPLDAGLLSQDGVALVDDTASLLVANGTGDFDDGWVVPEASGRVPGSLDWHVFACGHDYADCLGDFVRLSGRIAVPPLAALGVWWSRHWGDPFDGNPFGPMSQQNIVSEVGLINQRGNTYLREGRTAGEARVCIFKIAARTHRSSRSYTSYVGL